MAVGIARSGLRRLFGLTSVAVVFSGLVAVVAVPVAQGAPLPAPPGVEAPGRQEAAPARTVKPLRALAADGRGAAGYRAHDEGLGRGAPTAAGAGVMDTAVQDAVGDAQQLTDPLVNFPGQNGGSPPDTVGDVGPRHYLQMVNTTLAIYDKAGTLQPNFPAAINTLWAGLPAGTQDACRTNNDGDPIVLYDQQVDRWMVSQFTDGDDVTAGLQPAGPNGTFPMCIAYSQTGDPTGNWFLYQFNLPRSHDYMKYGIWPDGLYMSTFEGNNLGIYVFERSAMIAGSPAQMIDGGNIGAGTGTDNRGNRILPADWDGAATPPAGSPNWFIQSIDGDIDGGADRLQIYSATADFINSTLTFSLVTTLNTAPFDSDLNCTPNIRACIPQPSTTNRLDALSNRLMHRLQYRNFGSHEAMVVSQTVDGDGNDRAGLRWYELRRTGGGAWAIHQQSTYAPIDATEQLHRWMPSAAMDRTGNIALGYSISGDTTTVPGIRYTGRLTGDPLNSMTQGEHTVAVQNATTLTGSNRWGDYSSMNVDPVDDCTFWYTQMFIGPSQARSTQVAAFRYPSCSNVDLKVTKSAAATVKAGQQLTYTVNVRNAGQDRATNVVVTDTLPAGVQLLSTSTPCSGATTLTCAIGDLEPAANRTLSIVVRVPANFLSSDGSTSKTIINTAKATADQIDGLPGDNTDDATTTVEQEADLAVTKLCQVDSSTPLATNGTCQIFVDNFGPSDAQNVTLTDNISSTEPFTITSLSASPAGSCSSSPAAAVPSTSKTVTCTLGVEPSGGRTTVTVEVTATSGSNVDDTATAHSTTPDPVSGNNTATGRLSISPKVSLAITKSASPSPVTAGTGLTYTLTVSNGGPSPATNVVVTDELPAAVTFTTATPSQGNCGPAQNGVLTCTLGTVASGGSATVTVVVGVPSATPDGTVLANQATVRGDEPDPDNSDNLATVSVTVRAVADLSLAKAAEGDPVAGTTISYRFTVVNAGPSWARDLALTDQLPSGTAFVSAFLAVGGRPVGAPLACEDTVQGANRWSCPLGDLAPTGAAPLEVIVNVFIKPDVPDGTSLTNAALIGSDTTDPDNGNNDAAVSVAVKTRADLSILKTSDRDTYPPSSTIQYTITVSNLGPSDAQQVVVVDNLPTTKQAIFRFDTGNCTFASNTLTCPMGVIPVGSTKSFNVHVTVKGNKGEVTNVASVSTSTTDPVGANNTSVRKVLIKGGL